MNRKHLRYAGKALYGDRWQRAMARDLGISNNTVHRWDTGNRSIPGYLGDKLAELLWQRMLRLDQLRDQIKASDPLSEARTHAENAAREATLPQHTDHT